MEAAAAAAAAAGALAVRSGSAPGAAARGYRRRAAASSVLGRSRHRAPCGRRLLVRALPPELSEFLNPKLVPGSPSDTGDVSSLIPVSAVMLLLYLVTNWIVPELVMKKLNKPTAEEEAAAASASSSSTQQGGGGSGKLKKRRKKKKSEKETTNV